MLIVYTLPKDYYNNVTFIIQPINILCLFQNMMLFYFLKKVFC